VKSDGTILGVDIRILTDFGAYAYFPRTTWLASSG